MKAQIEKTIGKENIETFKTKFKETLAKEQKTNEIKSLDLELKTTTTEPTGLSLEFKTFTKDEYASQLEEQDYMKDSLQVLSIGFKAKDEASCEIIKTLYEQMRPMIDDMPFLKEKKDKISYQLRTKGVNVYIDVMLKHDEIEKALTEFGIDLGEHNSFTFALKSGFAPSDFFTLSFNQLIEKAVQVFLKVKGQTKSFEYFARAYEAGLKAIKSTDAKAQKKIKKALYIIAAINAFVQTNFNLTFDSANLAKLVQGYLATVEGENPEQSFEGIKMMAVGMGGSMIKPTLEDMMLLDPVKALNIDDIKIVVANMKFKSGCTTTIKLPGLSQSFADNFLA